MCGSVAKQWKYLSNIYYPEKKHFPKWLSKIVAIVAVPFVHGFYKGVQIMPTYHDGRLRATIKESCQELENNTSIFIFPEDSADGYHDVLKGYFAGFFVLARQYYLHTGKNVKIYNMYFNRKKNTIVIKKATTYLDLVNTGKSAKEIAEMMKQQANQVYEQMFDENNSTQDKKPAN